MSIASREIPNRELAAVLRAVRAQAPVPQATTQRARPTRAVGVVALALAISSALAIFPHSDAPNAWLLSPAAVGRTQHEEESRMRNLQNLAVVSSLAIGSFASAQNAVQWRVADGGNGHWYGMSNDSDTNFATRRAQVLALGADFASITSLAEHQFVFAYCQSIGAFPYQSGGDWPALGGYRLAGTSVWHWSDGEAFSYTPWDPGAPKVDLSMNAFVQMWGDHNVPNLTFDDNVSPGYLKKSSRVVIEWSADCNNDGLVDYGQILDGTLTDSDHNNIPDCCEQGYDCRFKATQWRTQDGGNGHWYALVPAADPYGWTAAKASAIAMGGYLATMTSPAENQWVFDHVASARWAWNGTGDLHGPWLGAFQDHANGGYSEPGGGWTWVTGEPWNFTSWNPGLPNNAGPQDFLHYYTTNAVQPGPNWDDIEEDFIWPPIGRLVRAAVVEWSADCNNDGIVDYGQILAGDLPDANHNYIPDCCEQGYECRLIAKQWRVQDGGNGHWYARVDNWLSWDEAEAAAEQKGGTLATITSQSEGVFIHGFVAPAMNFWAGGRRAGGSWQWVTGEAWSYEAWNCNHCHPSCQPDYPWEDYLEAMCWDGSSIRWNNYTSSNGRPSYVIEWSADCNNDGLVDYGQILDGTLADANHNNIPDSCEQPPCPGDITRNGVVDGVDLALILATWGTNGSQGNVNADVNRDGIVNGTDLSLVLGSWGGCL